MPRMVLDLSKQVQDGLLSELNTEGEALKKAAEAFWEAKAIWDVKVRKYAAVRDMITEQFGHSPYGDPTLFPEHRRFRFVMMKPGDAAEMALKEAKKPLTLQELVQELIAGGLAIDARAVNAALMQKGGITKDEKTGTYRLVAPIAASLL